MNSAHMIREQNAGTADAMDIRELTSDELEGVTGGWELDQLKKSDREQWIKYRQQLNSDDEDLRDEAASKLRSLKYNHEKVRQTLRFTTSKIAAEILSSTTIVRQPILNE